MVTFTFAYAKMHHTNCNSLQSANTKPRTAPKIVEKPEPIVETPQTTDLIRPDYKYWAELLG